MELLQNDTFYENILTIYKYIKNKTKSLKEKNNNKKMNNSKKQISEKEMIAFSEITRFSI